MKKYFMIPLLFLMLEPAHAQDADPSRKHPPSDAIADAQTPADVPATRPEQKKNEHDRSNVSATQAPPNSPALNQQPDQGKVLGFDFYRDPLNSKKPMMTPEEITKADIAQKPKVMEMQRKLLESRYNLTPVFSKDIKMSRGKPIPTGPTAKLKKRRKLGKLGSDEPRGYSR